MAKKSVNHKIESGLEDLIKKIVKFRDQRDWKQFHNPKDLAVSLALEAAEVLEHFQWKNKVEMTSHLKDNKEEIADELADVLYWVLLMSHDFKINILKATQKKLKKSAAKYPIKKAKGKHTKYNRL